MCVCVSVSVCGGGGGNFKNIAQMGEQLVIVILQSFLALEAF